MNYTDAQAKSIFRKQWPQTTKIWTNSGLKTHWLRAQPVSAGQSSPTAPRLHSPDSKVFRTQPDCLYVSTGLGRADTGGFPRYLDIVAIEVCSTIQNFRDKRSRYLAMTQSMTVELRRTWLQSKTRIQSGTERKRHELLGISAACVAAEESLWLPVRVLRVIYCLPNTESQKLYWDALQSIIPEGHEYLMPHSDLTQFNLPRVQKFLKGMSSARHFSRMK